MNLKNEIKRLNVKTRLYGLDIPIIGITGGIASGKSTVSKYLRSKKIEVIDADKIVKDIYKLQDTLLFLKTNYPSCIEADVVNFKNLREIFFKNTKDKEKIEKVIFAQFETIFMEYANKAKAHGHIIYDIPLLFEKSLEDQFDLTVLVYCPLSTQVTRLVSRDNIDTSLANSILKQQLDIEVKKTKADFIIDNADTKESLNHNTDVFIDYLFA